jgi:hypothetical protein
MSNSVLDPILFDLLEPSIRRIPNTAKVRGRELHGFLYERPFDQRYTHHLLEMLLSIIRFGGQGFAKTARSTSIKRSHHTALIQRVETSKHINATYVVESQNILSVGLPDPEPSYLEVLVEILLR